MDKKNSPKNILITGGAGFIGSHVVRRFVAEYRDYQIFNLDALTYAGNLENLKDIEQAPNYSFVKGDITDAREGRDIIISTSRNDKGWNVVGSIMTDDVSILTTPTEIQILVATEQSSNIKKIQQIFFK